jgi:hypothetical protein
MCTPVTPAVPYLFLGLQDVQWAVGNSRGARKLARTPHVNQKKKKIINKNKNSQLFLIFLMVFLVLLHGTTCRDIKRSIGNGEIEQGSETKHSSTFLQARSAIFKASESSNNKIKEVHSVSRRLVPSGPNPLHN